MKFWPGYIAPQGDNPPWNKYALFTLGLELEDNASEVGAGGGITAGVWDHLIDEENNYGTGNYIRVTDANGAIGDITLMDIKTVFGTMDSLYGYIVRLYNDLGWDKDLKNAYNVYNRVPIIRGMWVHNDSGSPINIALNEEATLIDNQPVANYGLNLGVAAVTFAVTDTGLCEIGVQVGTTDNGIHYPRPIEALAIVGDEADVFSGVEIYKSWDNAVWYPVDKAQYNANGWSGGEQYEALWRNVETGGAGEKGRIVAFAQPEVANYFKLVYNNSAGQQIRIHEVYAFNHQIDVGFTTDFVNYRYPIGVRNGEQFDFDFYNEPVFRVGLGPIAPSGEYPELDPTTGLWHDYATLSWYDYQLRSYVNGNGEVWNSDSGLFVSLTAYKSEVLQNPSLALEVPTSEASSQEKDTACNMVRLYCRPFVTYDTFAATSWYFYLGELYNNPLKCNTANGDGVKVNHLAIDATPGGTGDVEEVRIYNDSDKTSTGLQVHCDTDGLEVVTAAIPVGVTSFSLTDILRNVVSPYHCWNIMNDTHDALGALGTSSVVVSGAMAAWTEVLPAAPPAGNQYAIDYATGAVTTGNVTLAASFISFWYFSEGASATQLSESGAAWTDTPNILTFASGVCSPGSYLTLKVRSNLTNFAQEKDRTAKIIPRWSY